jgi:hypothetical protein
MTSQLIFSVFGSSAITLFLSWLLYQRKHKATADSLEKNNSSTEIANIVKMATEWRETATIWKNEADQNQAELIKIRKERLEEKLFFETKLSGQAKDISLLKYRLQKAYKRIEHLEKV